MSKRACILYLIPEAILLFFIEIGKFLGWSTLPIRILMYIAIVINTIVTAYYFYHYRKKNHSENLIAYAIFTTAVADFFMTLIGNDTGFIPGIIVFCIVQVIYALYLCPAVKWLLIRAAFLAACLVGLKVVGMLNLKNALGIADLSLLLVNAIIAWTKARSKTSLLFRIGITLFLFCDLSITIRTLTSAGVQDIVDYLVWIFYIPSQVAITLSYTSPKPHRQPPV